MDPRTTALRREIHQMLVTASQPLTSAQLFARSEIAETGRQVAKTVGNMRQSGKLEKLPAEDGETRARYRLPPATPKSDHPWRTSRQDDSQKPAKPSRPPPFRCPASLRQQVRKNQAQLNARRRHGDEALQVEPAPTPPAAPRPEPVTPEPVTPEQMEHAVAELDARNAVADARDRTAPRTRFGLFGDGSMELFIEGQRYSLSPAAALQLIDWLHDMAPAIANLRTSGALR